MDFTAFQIVLGSIYVFDVIVKAEVGFLKDKSHR